MTKPPFKKAYVERVSNTGFHIGTVPIGAICELLDGSIDGQIVVGFNGHVLQVAEKDFKESTKDKFERQQLMYELAK